MATAAALVRDVGRVQHSFTLARSVGSSDRVRQRRHGLACPEMITMHVHTAIRVFVLGADSFEYTQEDRKGVLVGGCTVACI